MRAEETEGRKVEGGILAYYRRTPPLIVARHATTLVKQPATR